MKQDLTKLTRAAVIASLYIALTLLSGILALSSGALQLRLSEALVLLPLIFPEAVWGLFIGCFISNIITGCVIWDIIFGSLATLIGAYFTVKLKRNRFFASLAPVASNALIVPFILKFAYGLGSAWIVLFLAVTLSEAVSAFLLAPVVNKKLAKHLNLPKKGI